MKKQKLVKDFFVPKTVAANPSPNTSNISSDFSQHSLTSGANCSDSLAAREIMQVTANPSVAEHVQVVDAASKDIGSVAISRVSLSSLSVQDKLLPYETPLAT